MHSVKVLHMADMHLEWPFAGIGADRLRGRMRREELIEVFASIIEIAAREEVQVLLLAGDLFEHAHVTRPIIKFIDDQFRRIPHTRIFISPGNHDPNIPGGYYETFPWAPNVHIFGPEPERVDLEGLPVSVYGWGFPTWEVTSYQLAGLKVQDPARINLLVSHGGDAAYHPLRPADLAAIGADYIALGHIHKATPFLEEGGRAIARYPGSPEALSFGEPGEHGILLGSVSKEGPRLDFVVTGRRRYITREIDLTGVLSAEEALEAVRSADSEAERARHCYRLVLTGAIAPELTLDLPVMQERLAPDFYFLRLEDETRPGYDLDRLALERSARGLLVRKLVAMELAEADPDRRRRIRRALALGLAAFEGRGVAR